MDEATYARPHNVPHSSSISYHITENYYGNLHTRTDNRIDNRVDNTVDNSILATSAQDSARPYHTAIVDSQMPKAYHHLLEELPSPTELFTGRESHLEAMREYFKIEASPSLDAQNLNRNCKVFVLHGLGGSGKTQVALKFLEMYGGWFWKTFFIDASNAKVLNLQFANISRQFKVGQSPREALIWLRAQQRNWLLIFDNADDPTINLLRFFPTSSHGNIIITTRNRGCIVYAPQSNIHITHLSPEDAVNLLLKVSLLSELPCDDSVLGSANLLAKDLGYIPLALAQAGAYIQQSSIIIEEYRSLLQKRRSQLLRNPLRNIQNMGNHDRPIYTTWDISYQRLDDSAKDFLKICSFLHYERIPKILFEKGIPKLLNMKYQDEQEVETCKSAFRTYWMSDGEWDTMKFNCTISQLTSYSLITVSSESLYSMHSLVHCWIQDSRIEGSRTTHKTVKKLIFLVMGGGEPSSDWYKAQRLLLPHALKISDEQDLFQLHSAAVNCYEYGMLVESEKLHGKILDICKKTKGIEHPETLRTINGLTAVYAGQGRLVEAEKLHVEILEIRQKTIGMEHADTLDSMNNLAEVYIGQGRLVEAEKLRVEILEIWQRTIGIEHADTLDSMNDLAAVYIGQGRLVEAEKLRAEILEIQQRTIPIEHPDTLDSMNDLAAVYIEQRRLVEAEKLRAEILEIQQRTIGIEHADTLDSMNDLAAVYIEQRRLVEAEKLRAEILEIQQRAIGIEHPDTLDSMDNLAEVYIEQGRLVEAEKLNAEILEIRQRTIGIEYANTLTSMNNLAVLYTKQGRLVEAEKLHAEVLEIRQRIMGIEHADTLDSMENLAEVYIEQGQLVEAEKLNAEILEIRQRTIGMKHRYSLYSMNSLARVYIEQGRLVEAEKLLAEVLEIRQRKIPIGHPDILASMDSLAAVYIRQGRLVEAEKLHAEILEIQQRTTSMEPPNTL